MPADGGKQECAQVTFIPLFDAFRAIGLSPPRAANRNSDRGMMDEIFITLVHLRKGTEFEMGLGSIIDQQRK
jgi:hypothetical protein